MKGILLNGYFASLKEILFKNVFQVKFNNTHLSKQIYRRSYCDVFTIEQVLSNHLLFKQLIKKRLKLFFKSVIISISFLALEMEVQVLCFMGYIILFKVCYP